MGSARGRHHCCWSRRAHPKPGRCCRQVVVRGRDFRSSGTRRSDKFGRASNMQPGTTPLHRSPAETVTESWSSAREVVRGADFSDRRTRVNRRRGGFGGLRNRVQRPPPQAAATTPSGHSAVFTLQRKRSQRPPPGPRTRVLGVEKPLAFPRIRLPISRRLVADAVSTRVETAASDHPLASYIVTTAARWSVAASFVNTKHAADEVSEFSELAADTSSTRVEDAASDHLPLSERSDNAASDRSLAQLLGLRGSARATPRAVHAMSIGVRAANCSYIGHSSKSSASWENSL
jgi:hypothetical protein